MWAPWPSLTILLSFHDAEMYIKVLEYWTLKEIFQWLVLGWKHVSTEEKWTVLKWSKTPGVKFKSTNGCFHTAGQMLFHSPGHWLLHPEHGEGAHCDAPRNCGSRNPGWRMNWKAVQLLLFFRVPRFPEETRMFGRRFSFIPSCFQNLARYESRYQECRTYHGIHLSYTFPLLTATTGLFCFALLKI